MGDKALAGIISPGSIGLLLKTYIDATISSRSTFAGGAVLAVTDGVTLAADQPDYAPSKAGDKMDLVNSPNITGLGVLVQSIWDRALANITAAGSIGLLLKTFIDAAISSRAAPGDVWDVTLADHENIGTTGKQLSQGGSGGDPSAIASAVWNELIANHLTEGTTGKQLAEGQGADPALIASAVWDSLMGDHHLVGSFGQRLQAVYSGTALGGSANSIRLDQGASLRNSFYLNCFVMITAGTGAGQCRLITAYNVGPTTPSNNDPSKIAAVSPNWSTVPTNDSQYMIVPFLDGNFQPMGLTLSLSGNGVIKNSGQ